MSPHFMGTKYLLPSSQKSDICLQIETSDPRMYDAAF